MPIAYSAKKNTGLREKSYGIPSPGKFNPLARGSPLMKVNKSVTRVSNTLPRFYSSMRDSASNGRGIPDIKTMTAENVGGFDNSTVNVRGKLNKLETEILEVNQVLNFHK